MHGLNDALDHHASDSILLGGGHVAGYLLLFAVRDIPGTSAGGPLPRPPGALPCVHLPVWRSGAPKTCGKCKRLLPPELFNRHGEGRQWWCRSCFRGYFRQRGEVHSRQSAAAKRMPGGD